jgi:hypothetical protein
LGKPRVDDMPVQEYHGVPVWPSNLQTV